MSWPQPCPFSFCVVISENDAYNKNGNSFLATQKSAKREDGGVGRNLERELESCLPRTVGLRTLPFSSILPHLNRAKARRDLFVLPSKTELASQKGADDPARSTEEHHRLVGADGWHGGVWGHTPALWCQLDKGHTK